ncbi:MAG TPA: alpha-hydroxy-acid oxidizing protein [Vicinamibacteria bacterium]|nr:alpha-hydroxy-acid oxidizing protein [Vicinamibacteria bacterium]
MWSEGRRRFLRFLLASPALCQLPGLVEALAQDDEVITAPELALEVMDFEAAARKALPPAHFGYLQTGVDDDATLRANREGFARLSLRPRRLVDVRHVDTLVSVLGANWDSPIILAPVAAQKAFHPEGELAVARAARAKKHLMVLSTVGTASVETASDGSYVART